MGNETTGTDFWIGPWRVSPEINQIQKNGTRIDLQNLSMQVLVYLAERQGQVVSKDELVDSLWQGRIVGDDAVHRRIADLRRHLGDDSKNPRFIQTIAKRGYRLVAPVRKPAAPNRRRWRLAAGIAALAVALGAGVALLPPASGVDEPVAEAIDEPVVTRVAIETSPPGAMVYYKRYADTDSDWKAVGMTPLEAELPVDTLRLRLLADGYRTVEVAAPNPSMMFNNVERDYYVVELPRAADMPDDMVYVPGGDTIVPLLGFYRHGDIGRYYIGRTEVSNREFAQFVADGGYENPDYWAAADDPDFDFSMVAERFVDSTGRPGPALWVNGGFSPGTGDLPVTGVSWYEAMAYARYRGMTLPTGRHWARAALGLDESRWPLAPALVASANIGASSPQPVTNDAALSTWGAVNMVGNVREWTTTRNGDSRLSLGLSFASQDWRYALPETSQPLSRRPDQGFRLASYIDEVTDAPMAMGDRRPEVPDLSAHEYAAIAEPLIHRHDPSVSARVDYVRPDHDWIRERLVIRADSLAESLPVLVFRPVASVGHVQPIVYLPPGDSYTGKIPSENIDITKHGIEFVVESGRALIWPIIAGTHDRFAPRQKISREEIRERRHKALYSRRAEIGALIDYLETRPEFDARNTGLLAASFGATFIAPSILATENRIRSAVLLSAALAPVDSTVFPATLNPNTYWPRVTTPVLVLNGSYDISIHATQNRDLLLQTIGSTAARKRAILYDAPHWPLPPHRVRNDTLSWFDEFLGPPGRYTTSVGE